MTPRHHHEEAHPVWLRVHGKPVAVVTGCSTGIGREAIHHLAKAGFFVVATARRVDSIADLEQPGSVECLPLDVTDATQRQAVVKDVLARHGHLEALVNNAGWGAIAAMEESTPELVQRMFDTNVFALLEMCRLVLPHMRQAGVGRIVNVASVAGHVSVPLLGAYSATKFAVRAMTQAMDNEVRRFGVRALLIEPGFIKTDFGKRAAAETRTTVPDPKTSPYARLYARWARRSVGDHGAHPRVIAKLIVRACASQSPSFHNFAPLHAKAANFGKRVLPDAWLHAGFRLWFR